VKYLPTKSHPLEEPEVVLNLWAYAGEDGYVLRLAARAYVMDGEDKQKLELLRKLASTDFLTADWHKVPANFNMNGHDGKKMSGVAHASLLSDANTHAVLFGSLMEELARSLPEQMRSIEGQYVRFKLDLPEEPLTVTTLVIEYEDGRLEPMVSGG
jgi:hypothetical protein